MTNTQKARKKETKIPTKRITLKDVQDFYIREFGDYLEIQDYTDMGCSHAVRLEAIIPIEMVVPFHILSPATFLRDYMVSEDRKKDEKRFGEILNHFKDLGFTEILGEEDLQVSGWYNQHIIIRPSKFQGEDLETGLIYEKVNCVHAPAGGISGLAGLSVTSHANQDPGHLRISEGTDVTPRILETLADSLKFKDSLNRFCQKNQVKNYIERGREGAEIYLFTLDLSKKGITKFVEIIEKKYPLFLKEQKSEDGLLRPKRNFTEQFTQPRYDLNVGSYYDEEDLYLPKGLEMIAKCLSGIYRSSRKSNC